MSQDPLVGARREEPTATSALGEALFATPSGRTDPYPLYHRLRAESPVLWAADAWLITGYEEARAALRDPRLRRGFTRTQELWRPRCLSRPASALGAATLLNLDGPPHTFLRRRVSRSFRPARIEALQHALRSLCDALYDPLEDAGGGDLVEGLTGPLSRRVIALQLGLPVAEAEALAEHARLVTAVLEVDVDEATLARADRAAEQLQSFFTELLDHKRRHLGDDVLSDVAGQSADEVIDDTKLVALAIQLFVAASDNVANQVGNALVALLAEPAQAELWRTAPERCRGVPEEFFRHDAAVQLTTRAAAEDVELDGVVMGAGDPVVILLGAANRDPARYADPDRLELRRHDVRPLSFGGGVHHCVGSALAGAELTVALQALFERFDLIEAVGTARSADRLTMRGPKRLEVRLARRRPRPASDRTTTAMSELGGQTASRPVVGDHGWRAAYRARLEATPRGGDEQRQIVGLLSRIRFFTTCTEEELGSLAATAYHVAFEAGEVICAEGLSSDECWVVAEGEVEVKVAGEVVARVHADSVLGERGVLFDQPRAATVTATDHVITYALSRTRLKQVVASSATAREGMLADVALRYGEGQPR